jgi:SP family sugar:H+ symporter-like MFS transporter
MPVFLEYFGERTEVSTEHPTGYYFTNVRAGVIVALVSITVEMFSHDIR